MGLGQIRVASYEKIARFKFTTDTFWRTATTATARMCARWSGISIVWLWNL